MMRQPLPFPLPPEVTRVILGGESPIDLEGLRVQSDEEAREFALNYGFDLDILSQRAHVMRVYEDALKFITTVLLDGSDLKVPLSFYGLEDPHNLLLWASERMGTGGTRSEEARWSCVILRVMHTLFHVDYNVNLRFLPEIQRQVFEPYDRYLVQREDGSWLLKGAYEVPLVAVERKENKDRTSMLLKMLHKPENVAETIYDQIGIRLVAEDPLRVLEAIRFLLDHYVIMATSIKPSRSRNLMIDLPALEAWMEGLPPAFELAQMGPEARRQLSESLTLRAREAHPDNPHMSQDYSAVQFTARTLIRLPSPATGVLGLLQKRVQALGDPGLSGRLGIPELIQSQEEFTFFFAHEVQIMERTGFQSSQSGPASHAEYKQRQRSAARRRVLRGILREEAPC
ncbi:MAG: TIGR04552 family protein [Holophagaceae bacterium]|nr:TIGR04552 family protein [Holophagaceae bacterium]